MYGALHGAPCASGSGRWSVRPSPGMRSTSFRTRALSSRRAAERPTRLTSRRRPDDAPLRVCWTRRVVARAAEIAASARFVKSGQRASIGGVFHRTMASERTRRTPPCDGARCDWDTLAMPAQPADALRPPDVDASCDTPTTLTPVLTWPRSMLLSGLRQREHANGSVRSASRRDARRGNVLRRPRAASGLDLTASPPRSETRRRFGRRVSPLVS